jgi:phytoene dehydrogenase-like protein
MSRTNCVVVGGGLCGLFSSIVLADKFEKVYLVERDDECGGLLRSSADDRGIVYDQGTHIPEETTIPERCIQNS